MTVRELAERLRFFKPDDPVMLSAEGGFAVLKQMEADSYVVKGVRADVLVLRGWED